MSEGIQWHRVGGIWDSTSIQDDITNAAQQAPEDSSTPGVGVLCFSLRVPFSFAPCTVFPPPLVSLSHQGSVFPKVCSKKQTPSKVNQFNGSGKKPKVKQCWKIPEKPTQSSVSTGDALCGFDRRTCTETLQGAL